MDDGNHGDERAYRRALGAFATGVAVIARRGADGAALGLTVNSFTSVSLRPRLVLWCLDDRSERYAAFAEAELWGVSVLSAGQAALSTRCAAGDDSSLPESLLAPPLDPEAPTLAGALARFSCRTHDRRVYGDHLVIIGAVEAFAAAPGAGLSYFRGRYGEASDPEMGG